MWCGDGSGEGYTCVIFGWDFRKNLFLLIFSHGTNASRNHDEIIATIAAAALPDRITTMAMALDLLMTDRTHYRSRVLTYSCTHRAASALLADPLVDF